MPDVLTYTGELVVVRCWCGIRHAIPSELNRQLDLDPAHNAYCPLGHSYVRTGSKTATEKLAAAQARERHLEDQLRAAEADAEAGRVRLVRERERVANGVCPCCNRSFVALRRHIASQHPGYDPGNLTAASKYRCSCGREFDTAHGLAIHQGRMRSDDWTSTSTSRWRRHLTVVGRR